MKKVSLAILAITAISIYLFSSAYAQSSEYKIQPSDVITITVHNQPDLTTKTRVTKEGNITFPLVGQLKVQGLTVHEVEQELKTRLEKDYLVTAQVLVFIETYHTRQISVVGEVKSPGKFDIPSEKPVTLMQAIGMAGGFTKEGDVKNVTVMRVENGEQKTIKINPKDITTRGEKDKDIVVEPGDVISIPEGFNQVSVIGEVKNSGKYDMPQEKVVTLLEAIGMAGGFTKEGDVKNVTVMRVEKGEQKTIKINTKDITVRGEKDKDIVIEPGDVISVPEGFSEVSVIGEVKKPGKYDMPQEKNMTLLEAIAMAEGFTKDAEVTRVKVMRVENGTKRTIVINTKDITEKDEKDKDIILESGDIVYVPESFF